MDYYDHMAVCQNLVPLVNIKIAGKWMFIPLKMVLIGIDPYPYHRQSLIVDKKKRHLLLLGKDDFPVTKTTGLNYPSFCLGIFY
jgi:hypothetical protein